MEQITNLDDFTIELIKIDIESQQPNLRANYYSHLPVPYDIMWSLEYDKFRQLLLKYTWEY